ncbi:MAG: hypothetical protein ACF8PN_14925 [Phycisphaerales bacterium]
MRRYPLNPFLVVILFAAGILFCPQTRAQGGLAGAGALSTRLDHAEIERLADFFDLDELERETLGVLYDGYLQARDDAFQTYRDELRRITDDARRTQEWSNRGELIQAAHRRYETQDTSLLRRFFEDARTLLDSEEQRRWPGYERDLRRRQTLVRGAQLSGEGVDLTDLAASIDLADESAELIAPTLDSYEIELDTVLVARNEAIERHSEIFRDLSNLEEGDELDQRRRLLERRRNVRDLNTRYAEAIAAQLPLDESERFRAEFQRRSFRSLYEPTRAHRYFERVLGLDDLTEAQRSAVEQEQAGFLGRLGEFNERLSRLQREREELLGEASAAGWRVVRRGSERSLGPEEDEDAKQAVEAYFDLFERRNDLINATIDAVFANLTPEQQVLAPKPVDRSLEKSGEFGGERPMFAPRK